MRYIHQNSNEMRRKEYYEEEKTSQKESVAEIQLDSDSLPEKEQGNMKKYEKNTR